MFGSLASRMSIATVVAVAALSATSFAIAAPVTRLGGQMVHAQIAAPVAAARSHVQVGATGEGAFEDYCSTWETVINGEIDQQNAADANGDTASATTWGNAADESASEALDDGCFVVD